MPDEPVDDEPAEPAPPPPDYLDPRDGDPRRVITRSEPDDPRTKFRDRDDKDGRRHYER